MHWWIGLDGVRSPDRAASVIAELDADVVALQEVHLRDINVSPAPELVAAIPRGYSLDAGPTFVRGCAQFGNAILSRLPVLTSRCVDLSIPGREPRGAVLTRIELGAGITMTAAATHFGLRPNERVLQASLMLTALDAFTDEGDVAVVLLGDLNEWMPRARVLRLLRRAFGSTSSPPSFPAFRPIFSLDKVLVRPRSVLGRVAVHGSALAQVASDHLPVVAELRP